MPAAQAKILKRLNELEVDLAAQRLLNAKVDDRLNDLEGRMMGGFAVVAERLENIETQPKGQPRTNLGVLNALSWDVSCERHWMYSDKAVSEDCEGGREIVAATRDEARRELRKRGWRVRDRKWWCPACLKPETPR